MNRPKDKEDVLHALLEHLKSLPEGTKIAPMELFAEVFPHEDYAEYDESFDLTESLYSNAEKVGLYLDASEFADMVFVEKSPGIPFVIRKSKPSAAFDMIIYEGNISPNATERLGIDLLERRIAYKTSELGFTPIIHQCTTFQWEHITEGIISCHLDQWDDNYNESTQDGMSWRLSLLIRDKIVRQIKGNNGFPDEWTVFWPIKQFCRRVVLKEDFATSKPDECRFCGSKNIKPYIYRAARESELVSGEYLIGSSIAGDKPTWGCENCGANYYKGLPVIDEWFMHK